MATYLANGSHVEVCFPVNTADMRYHTHKGVKHDPKVADLDGWHYGDVTDAELWVCDINHIMEVVGDKIVVNLLRAAKYTKMRESSW